MMTRLTTALLLMMIGAVCAFFALAPLSLRAQNKSADDERGSPSRGGGIRQRISPGKTVRLAAGFHFVPSGSNKASVSRGRGAAATVNLECLCGSGSAGDSGCAMRLVNDGARCHSVGCNACYMSIVIFNPKFSGIKIE